MSLPKECARCDKPFTTGETLCVVAFGHLTFNDELEADEARVTDRTVLCEACEEHISNDWPFVSARTGTRCTHIMAGTDGEKCWLIAGHTGDHERSPTPDQEWPP